MSEPEKFPDAGADRAPTPDEAAAADAVAEEIDVDSVAEHYEHMNELGAQVKGAGQVEPEAD